MTYKIRNGKIQASLCEVNVVHHCNLSCRACSHLSHLSKKYFVNPDQVLNDFSALAPYYHPQHVRLLGGEPLLHPNLLDVIDAVIESGISETIRVVTNGVLLDRMTDRFWQKVDQIYISIYPDCGISKEKLNYFRHKAGKHDIELNIKFYKHFRESYSEYAAESDLAQRIFSTCQIAHTWRCHAIFEGYFFRCSPSLLIPRILQKETHTNIWIDGLKITSSEDFTDRLREFLSSKKPLNACRYCLGSVGKRFVPTQESPWDSGVHRSAEELIDRKYLRYYEWIGNRRTPYWMQRAGATVRKAMTFVLNAFRGPSNEFDD